MSIDAFPAGLLVGALIGAGCALFALLPGQEIKRYTDTQRSIDACQKDLPRSQTCELVAVPTRGVIHESR